MCKVCALGPQSGFLVFFSVHVYLLYWPAATHVVPESMTHEIGVLSRTPFFFPPPLLCPSFPVVQLIVSRS